METMSKIRLICLNLVIQSLRQKVAAKSYKSILEEFPLILECKLLHTFEIGLHTQFIGEIIDVKADETVLTEKGMPDIKQVNPILYATAEKGYFGVGEKIGDAFSIGKGIK
jgi:flavin reductase (DIM6/NTAB) family NADH-FMN oxidoreductase RutF